MKNQSLIHYKIFPIIGTITLVAFIFFVFSKDLSEPSVDIEKASVVEVEEEKTHPVAIESSDNKENQDEESTTEEGVPIDRALDRVTKKQFGIKVSPNNSPVQPEKFSGFHTGVDFEIFPEEIDADIEIRTICAGPVAFKDHVSGYGGVVIQECVLQNKSVTVVYGHLRLSGVVVKLNQNLNKGQLLGVLGKGFSKETDGERKHLHLAIHKGETISLLGYVGNSNLLDKWIDPILFLRKK